MSPVRTRAADKARGQDRLPLKHASDAKDNNPSKTAKTKDNGHIKKVKRSSSAGEKGQLQSKKGEGDTPNVVETGILNYFVRGRVEIEDPQSIDEIARGYLVMRPLPKDLDLTKRPLPGSLTARMLALPKKQLPHSPGDRFMAFVDEAEMSYSKLADGFLAPREYNTKTAGKRHVPAATPVGEGVYAIIQTENETHLAYLATLPEEKNEFQRELGFYDRGSFIISSKNPKFAGPAYARLPSPPDYPKDILEEFGSYRWIPTRPQHLDYKNTQLLLIGHGEKAHLSAGNKKGQEDVEEEMERLMEEDLKGMRHLSNDESESIFADLRASSQWFHDIPKSLAK